MAVPLSTLNPGDFFSTGVSPSPVKKYLLSGTVASVAGKRVAYSLSEHLVVELVDSTQVDVLTPTVVGIPIYSV